MTAYRVRMLAPHVTAWVDVEAESLVTAVQEVHERDGRGGEDGEREILLPRAIRLRVERRAVHDGTTTIYMAVVAHEA